MYLSLKNNSVSTCSIDFKSLTNLLGVSITGNPIAINDPRASSKYFPQVGLFQKAEAVVMVKEEEEETKPSTSNQESLEDDLLVEDVTMPIERRSTIKTEIEITLTPVA